MSEKIDFKDLYQKDQAMFYFLIEAICAHNKKYNTTTERFLPFKPDDKDKIVTIDLKINGIDCAMSEFIQRYHDQFDCIVRETAADLANETLKGELSKFEEIISSARKDMTRRLKSELNIPMDDGDYE